MGIYWGIAIGCQNALNVKAMRLLVFMLLGQCQRLQGLTMDKPTFTAALKRAYTLRGYPLYDDERDTFYDALKGFDDADLLYALDAVGKGTERISYASIRVLIDEKVEAREAPARRERERRERAEEDARLAEPMPPETREAIDRLLGKKWG